MEFFRQNTQIDFLGIKKYTTTFSIFIIIISLFFIFTKGIKLGLDFTGGYQIQVNTSKILDSENITKKIEEIGLTNSIISTLGDNDNYLIKFTLDKFPSKSKNLEMLQQQLINKVEDSLDAKVISINYIGPKVGQELVSNGILAIIISLICILIYISSRFEIKFGISSCITLLHDSILIFGVFAAFQLEFDLTVLAAVLAVIGYSLNDTVVIYDRIRENFKKMLNSNITEIINRGINETLSRTILTSSLTMIVVLVLFFFGGIAIHNFSLALILGILVGTYSSIYVSAVLAVSLGLNRESLLSK